MKKIAFAALLAATLVTPAMARDDIVKITLDSVMEQPDAKAKLDGSVRFFLEGASTPRVLKKLGTDTTNQKTNAFNKSPDTACKWAALSALIALQEGARRAGANAVVNIVSYYKKETVTSPTEIDCHDGTLIAGVALKGDYVTIKP